MGGIEELGGRPVGLQQPWLRVATAIADTPSDLWYVTVLCLTAADDRGGRVDRAHG